MKSVTKFVFTLIVTALAISSSAQEQGKSGAQLLDRCDGGNGGCSGYDAMMEHTLNFGYYRDQPGTVAAIRVCSREPTPIAFSIAATDVRSAARWLEDVYGFTPDRIRFLRSEDCQIALPGTATTELWGVPSGAKLPSAVEVVEPCQYQTHVIGSGVVVKKKNYDGDRNYKESVKQLVIRLREHPTETGLVLGYCFEKPRRSLQKRLEQIKLTMESSGIPQERYWIRMLFWNGGHELPVGDSEPRFPEVFTAYIVEKCSVR
jgi:hypothetical protein